MHPKHFIDKLDETKIVAAIKQAELATSGEIRVTVSHGRPIDVLSAARKYFIRSGMDRVATRNAVLIYFAPRTQSFAIWGDVGVHEKCGDEFWGDSAKKISGYLKTGHLMPAVEEAVRDVGELLARHFPRQRA